MKAAEGNYWATASDGGGGGGELFMLLPMKFECVEVPIAAGVPCIYTYRYPYVGVCLIPTCAKFDSRQTFRNVTTAYVVECLYRISRLIRRVLFLKCPQESPCVLTSVKLAIEMVHNNVDVICVVQNRTW